MLAALAFEGRHAMFLAQCGTKHKIEATNQIPHPSGVVVKCPIPSTLRSVKFPPPRARERVKCPGMPGYARGGGGGGGCASFELIGTLRAHLSRCSGIMSYLHIMRTRHSLIDFVITRSRNNVYRRSDVLTCSNTTCRVKHAHLQISKK